MRKYKAIVSDIDETIIHLPATITPNINPSKRVIEAVKKVQAQGVVFSIATGKPFFLVEQLVEKLALKSPIIVDNGSAIYDSVTKKSIWESVMTTEKINALLDIVQKFKKRVRISDGKESFYIEKHVGDKSKTTKFLAMGLSVNEADEFIVKVEKNFKDLALSKAQSYDGDEFFDVYVTNAEATKQHAVVKVAEILGITTQEIIGIGDHYNDFPLLMACGLKVAMGNAVPELKEIADYIAPSVEEDGVVDVIEKFVLNR